MYSLYDLAYICLEKNNNLDKGLLLKAIAEGMDNGGNATYFINSINRINKGSEEDFYNTCRIGGNGNFIDSKKFYYHKELKICSKPPTVDFDIITGSFVTVENEKRFIEIKASYTIDDLIEYLKTKPNFKNTIVAKGKIIGALNYLINRYGIDLLLFLIDTADLFFINKQRYPSNVFEIEDYIEIAKSNYNQCVNSYKAINDITSSNPYHKGLEVLKDRSNLNV